MVPASRETCAPLSNDRCVLILLVIAGISLQDPAQVRLAQDDEMIQTLAPDRSDQPFGKAILPR